MAYRFYIADSLMVLPQHGHMTRHLREIYYKPKVVDNRSGDQIVVDVMKNAGLHFKE